METPDTNLAQELEELHVEVVRMVRAKVAQGGENDDLRLALALLKQNNVTANLNGITEQQLKQRMAGKLNFSELERKIIPLRGPEAEPPLRKSGGRAQA